MSNPATFDQGYQMMNLAREADVSLESLQTLYATGLLSDLLKAEDPAGVDREQYRVLLGFDPSVFRVTLGGPETTDEIVGRLKANGFAYVNEWITQVNFPLNARPAVEEDEIVIHDPGTSFSEDEGLAILTKEGLLRPTYQHALRFAREHGTATTSKKKSYVIFLHEPWLGQDRDRRVLYIDRNPDGRELSLDCPGVRFGGNCVLAGVHPRKQPSAA